MTRCKLCGGPVENEQDGSDKVPLFWCPVCMDVLDLRDVQRPEAHPDGV